MKGKMTFQISVIYGFYYNFPINININNVTADKPKTMMV